MKMVATGITTTWRNGTGAVSYTSYRKLLYARRVWFS